MYGVYALWSRKDSALYIDYSKDVRKRYEEHEKGRVPATCLRRPVILIYCELFRSRGDAARRKQYLKTGWGRNHLRKVLKETLQGLDAKI